MNNHQMNTQELKEAIGQDIQTLKTLDVDIMPANQYYQANIRLFLYVFLKMYVVVVLGNFLPWLIHIREILKHASLGEALLELGYVELLGIGVCLFVFLFLYSPLNHYVLFKYQLKDTLQTGKMLLQKMHSAATIFYRIYVAIVLIPSAFLFPGVAVLLAFVGFLISGLLTNIIIEMELNRIGISTLFTLIKAYFNQDKKSNHDVMKNH
ncbi:hypothetical protein OQJ26_17160 [Legionella sp. PATHC038]|uniref:hypothetical protein n=1 Tax=Legionella sheltonii TaxID=2992041 RepID=UPI0022434D15|nr:hypothetical protein [Legionella sp. PATHC038]MCW8400511.1 hypothetical protein [Legionella sp. PATHC038]